MTDKLKLGGGGFIRSGQYHAPKGQGLARDAQPKNLPEPAISHGMKRTSTGDVHGWLHGQVATDSTPLKTYERAPVPVHAGMYPAALRSGATLDGKGVLESAGRLGRPKA